jgi:putative transposase
LVIDTRTKLPLGRPWLTSLIDVHTKMIVGIYVSFTPPSYLAVMRCLLHAIRSKTYIRNKYPRIEHPWPTYGIPEVLVVDNAKEFYSKDFKDACVELGIEVEYAPRGAAWFKNNKERFYRTLNDALLHELPGTTFSNVVDKKDYNPKKHAVVTIDALLEALHVWIVDIYHQKVHRGIKDVPFRRWNEAIIEWPPNLPPRNGQLEIVLGHIDERSISSSGIEFYGLFYNCKDLGLIRRHIRSGEKARIKYDPDDISFLYVFDKQRGRYLPVPALDQDYTKGLTMWQHLVIRNFARKQAQTYVDREALCRAKAYLQEIIDSEILSSKKLAGKGKTARYLNIGQPNYAELVSGDVDAGSIATHDAKEFSQLTQVIGNTSGEVGVSDIGNALNAISAVADSNDNGLRDTATIMKGSPYTTSANPEGSQNDETRVGGNVGRREANEPGKTSRKSRSKSLNTVIDDEEDDSDHSLAGWSADYDLPM